MSKIVLNSKDLDGKNKLQFMIQKYGDNIIWYDGKFSFHIKDEDNEFGRRFKVDVLSEEEEKVRKYASHLYHKGSLWKVISEWRKNLIDEVRENKKKILNDDSVKDERYSYDPNNHLTQNEIKIIEGTLYRKMRRDGVDY